ncbi:MAG: hypothetical protein IPJ98_24645 [Bryobacterales bacterium]|nr:hypothetical protein [Bryobacterales bacterium]
MRLTRVLNTIALATAVIAGLAAQTAQAQTYTILVNQQSTSAEIPEGGTVTFAATNIGAPSDAIVTLTNRAGVVVQINTLTLTGSSDFTLVNSPASPHPQPHAVHLPLPAPQPGHQQPHRRRHQHQLHGEQRLAHHADQPRRHRPRVLLQLHPAGGNASAIASGATSTFPATAIDATSTATVVITNRGTAQGTVQSITVSGVNFAGVGIPLPNTTVDANRTVQFTVQFTSSRSTPRSAP